jgi:hypothetical protein
MSKPTNQVRKATILFSKQEDKRPAWILPVTELMLNLNIKYHPTVDDIILEARGLLASRYGWKGRELDVAETFCSKNCMFSAAEVNKNWDSYNSMMELLHKERYLGR